MYDHNAYQIAGIYCNLNIIGLWDILVYRETENGFPVNQRVHKLLLVVRGWFLSKNFYLPPKDSIWISKIYCIANKWYIYLKSSYLHTWLPPETNTTLQETFSFEIDFKNKRVTTTHTFGLKNCRMIACPLSEATK